MDEITYSETTKYLKLKFPNVAEIQRLDRFGDLPIKYLAPLKVDEIEDSSLDFIISRTVLEHIKKKDLVNLFTALRPKIANNGVMIHLIDHSDHFEHNDKSISRINFLTWSERKHAVINYLIKDGENRMRHHEYELMFEDSGYKVIDEITDLDQETLEISKSLKLSYPFSKMTPEQLATLTSIYVLRPAEIS
jgi:predicted mannosyl-3-phosphoglycerate phosphatase (HAD superfamily)